jgi:hypothetical protein
MPSPSIDRAPEVLEWRVHLARRQPARAVAALAIIFGAAVGTQAAFGWLSLSLATAALLFAAAGEFLFPITYRLTADGVEARNPFAWRRIAWKEVKRVYAGNEEIKLSPFAERDRREPFRGVLLRCEGNRAAVLEAIQDFRDAATGA